MRTIKFRGKAKDDIYTDCGDLLYEKDQWVYGNLIVSGSRCWIVGGVADVHYEVIDLEFWCEVDPATVGQYIGMKDDNGNKIYEKDLLAILAKNRQGYYTQELISEVVYGEGCGYYLKAVGWQNPNSFKPGRMPKIKSPYSEYDVPLSFANTKKAIGNTIDNPELLKA